jgi:tripartite-type tricarboxylate transporter receptor subunit TctC
VFNRIFHRLVGTILLAASSLVAAQGTWPSHEINLTVMYGPGGNTDLMTRLVARHLEAALGQSVVVMNKMGAMGTIGPDFVSHQKPDGYNLGIVTASTIALAPHLVPVKFTLADFAYVAAFANPRFGVAVRADSPYKTMQDLIDAGRSGHVFFASGAALNSLIIQNIAQAAKTKFDIVNYKSGTEVSSALLSDQVQAILANPSDILPQLPGGKMRLLASASPARWPEMPDVQSIKELGIDAGAESWTAIAAPKGTPPEIIKKLETTLLAIAAKPEFQEALSKLGNDPLQIPGAQFEANVKRRAVEWGEGLKAAGLLPPK